MRFIRLFPSPLVSAQLGRERWTFALLAKAAGGLAMWLLLVLPAHAETVLRVFAGGSSQRPEILRELVNGFERGHTGVRVEISTGASTSEMQRKYLSTLLNAEDSTYDAFLIDIINPAQYAAAGWLEPLDGYFEGNSEDILREFLPVQQGANRIGGKVVALPYVTDAQFLYYRKDLLDRYQQKVPETWDELSAVARTILNGEKDASLHGLSIQGAPIEGAVCTFLLPYWSQGKDILDDAGRLALDPAAALAGFRVWRNLMQAGVLKANVAETKTGDTTNEFKAGSVIFAINWGSAWGVSQRDADSRVKGKIGVTRPPSVTGGIHATSVGGWQWAVSAFSRHKTETVALVRYLTSREVLKTLTLRAWFLPARTDLYEDADILAQLPWLRDAQPVVLSARTRPVTRRYGEVSDTLRVTTSAVLGGSLSPEKGVAQIQSRLRRVLR